MVIVLLGQTVGEATFTKARKLGLVGALIAIAAIFFPHQIGRSRPGFEEIAYQFVHSPSGRIVLAPFGVFARILTANPVLPDALKWAGVAIAMIGAMLLIVMWWTHTKSAAGGQSTIA